MPSIKIITLTRPGLIKRTRSFYHVPLVFTLFVFCFQWTGMPSYGAETPKEIIVSAAISLKDAFIEIGELHEERTGVKVNFNFGASGILQKQIEGGAPVDVFASAGEKQMDELDTKGLIDRETRRNFVRNVLVLVIPKDLDFNIRSFYDLEDPKVRRIAIGNPKTVPVGQYTQQLLTNTKLWDKLQPRLIFAEDVRQVLDYVVRGEVEAGIVYASDVQSSTGKVRLLTEAHENLHDPILYPIAVIVETRQKQAARGFVELVLSSEGQSILIRYGFLGVM